MPTTTEPITSPQRSSMPKYPDIFRQYEMPATRWQASYLTNQSDIYMCSESRFDETVKVGMGTVR
jgi:hypothetical protein